jgi:hypothetical protein
MLSKNVAVWNCQTGGKHTVANRVYARDQLQPVERGEARQYSMLE